MRPTSAHSGLRGPPLSLCDIMQRGYLPHVSLLVSLGTNLEARDSTGRTPLMLTAYVQPEEWGVGVARLLIQEGVRMSHRDKFGMNVLHHASVYERVELAKVLLNALDFDLVQTDRFGNTALHYAAMSGNVALVKLLASYHQRYKHPFTKTNRHGRTARDEALCAGSQPCADILEDAASAMDRHKDADIQSECESFAAVVVVKEESIAASEEIKPVFSDELDEVKMIVPDDLHVKTTPNEDQQIKLIVNEDQESSLRKDHEEGGLFGNSQISFDEPNKKLLSPYHTPPPSERSVDSKAKSQDNIPRMRRSGVRRAHTAVRRLSAGSSCSSRSGLSLQKKSLQSARSSSNTITNNADNINDDASTTNENKTLVQVSEILQRPKTSHPHHMRRGSVLSENTSILNSTRNLDAVHVTSTSRQTLKTASTQSFRREPTFMARSPSQLLPYEKNPERVIHVASEHDFRNTREYVLKLTKMEYSAAHFDTDNLPVLGRRPSLQMDEDNTRKGSAVGSWRDNMRFLYRHLEYQCSPSWRDAAQPPPDPLTLTPTWAASSTLGDEADELKDKKIRRPSSSNRPSSQMNDVSTSGNTKRKHSAKQRKISAISPPSGTGRGGEQGGGDNVTVSSADSVSTTSKKKADLRPDLVSAK